MSNTDSKTLKSIKADVYSSYSKEMLIIMLLINEDEIAKLRSDLSSARDIVSVLKEIDELNTMLSALSSSMRTRTNKLEDIRSHLDKVPREDSFKYIKHIDVQIAEYASLNRAVIGIGKSISDNCPLKEEGNVDRKLVKKTEDLIHLARRSSFGIGHRLKTVDDITVKLIEACNKYCAS